MQEQFGCGYMDGRSDGRVELGAGVVWAWVSKAGPPTRSVSPEIVVDFMKGWD